MKIFSPGNFRKILSDGRHTKRKCILRLLSSEEKSLTSWKSCLNFKGCQDWKYESTKVFSFDLIWHLHRPLDFLFLKSKIHLNILWFIYPSIYLISFSSLNTASSLRLCLNRDYCHLDLFSLEVLISFVSSSGSLVNPRIIDFLLDLLLLQFKSVWTVVVSQQYTCTDSDREIFWAESGVIECFFNSILFEHLLVIFFSSNKRLDEAFKISESNI